MKRRNFIAALSALAVIPTALMKSSPYAAKIVKRPLNKLVVCDIPDNYNYAQALGNSLRQMKEQVGAAVMNRAFSDWNNAI